MPNPAKRKGEDAERGLVGWLRAHGFPNAERSRAGWADDRGDILGIPGVVLEVKHQQRISIVEWLHETHVEQQNAAADYGVLIIRRPFAPDPASWIAALPLDQLARLLRAAGHGDPP